MSLLAQLLRRDGYRVSTALMGQGETSPDQALGAEVIVLPLPMTDGRGNLSAPLAERQWPVEEVLRRLQPDQILCAGQIPPAVRESARLRGLRLWDYYDWEPLQIYNAVPTAEGAIALAMEHLPVTIRGIKALVLGFGRIGSFLSRDLAGLGAEVTVAARGQEARTRAECWGYRALPTDALAEVLGEVRLIFNTVPSLLLDETKLALLRPDCLCLDLASQPGIDRAAAERRGISSLWAKGLPGKAAPETAAAAIRDSIYHLLEEQK